MIQQVFISYSNENQTDRQVADRIYDTLKAREVPCWVEEMKKNQFMK